MNDKKIEYFHIREYGPLGMQARGGHTIAMEPVDNLLEKLRENDTITLNIGVAHCHSDDNYNKQTGRCLAYFSIRPTEFKVVKSPDSFAGYESWVLVIENENHKIGFYNQIHSRPFIDFYISKKK